MKLPQAIAEKVNKAKAEQRRKVDDLPDVPRTEGQRALAAKHGTPRQFARACADALGEISIEEADDAVRKYLAEWNACAPGVPGGPAKR